MQAAWPCHTCSVICPRRQPDATKSRTAPRRCLRRLFNRTPRHPAPRTRTRPGRPRHEHLASLGTTRLRAQRLDGVTGALNVPGGRHVHRPIRILKVRQLSRKCENVRAVLAQRGVREQLVCAACKGKGTGTRTGIRDHHLRRRRAWGNRARGGGWARRSSQVVWPGMPSTLIVL